MVARRPVYQALCKLRGKLPWEGDVQACLSAQTCIDAGAELLSTDQDFAAIARHTPLRLCAV